MRTLVVDDDAAVVGALREAFQESGLDIDYATDGESALKKISEVDLLVTDLRLPGMDGTELFQQARRRKPGIEVVIMTAYGTIPSAVEAIRRGARAYLTKPFDPEELISHIRNVEETLKLRAIAFHVSRGELVGSSLLMQKVYEEIDLAATSDSPVLITGETGTGKELAARAIHDLSPRKKGPFIAVNMGALPRELAESELFGREKGAFTGADVRKRGRFALAEGGTLFLDELSSLPLEMQPKLLRAIETKEIWSLGAEKPEQVQVRFVAATNSDIDAMIREGNFREDLYYRLNMHRILMPPLRNHPEDIPTIARSLVDRHKMDDRSAGHGATEISGEALAAIVSRPWPGNVRELANVLGKAVLRSKTMGATRIEAEHLDPEPDSFPSLSFKGAKDKAAEEWSKRTIRTALAMTEGNVSKAAVLLKMNQNALFRLIKKYGLKP
ncbi:MAG: sigma-54 dependent transcriptional regulator [Deltaproteobacteria bacterium]|nr:sigma-54 dependent transcriptional regulator [Deltaproteobacteria bacterium]